MKHQSRVVRVSQVVTSLLLILTITTHPVRAIVHHTLVVGFGTTCLIEGGVVTCFGSNAYRSMGLARDFTPFDEPVPLRGFVGVTGVKGICLALWHACVYTESGDALCAGSNGDFGLLGNPAGGAWSTTPIKPVGLDGITAKVACGAKHTCALLTSGAVRCWGIDEEDALLNGAGGTDFALTPAPAVGFEIGGAVDIEANGFTTCVLTVAGGVMCGGPGGFGNLGDGTKDDSPVFKQVSGLTSGVASIAVGSVHTCALKTDASVYCWGFTGDNLMLLKQVQVQSTPRLMAPLGTNVRSLVTGGHATAVIMKDGTVRVWGQNYNGELGLGFTIPLGAKELEGPTVVPGCNSVDEMSLGWGIPGAACLRTADRALYCSGNPGLAGGATTKFTRVPGVGPNNTVSTCVFTVYQPFEGAANAIHGRTTTLGFVCLILSVIALI